MNILVSNVEYSDRGYDYITPNFVVSSDDLFEFLVEKAQSHLNRVIPDLDEDTYETQYRMSLSFIFTNAPVVEFARVIIDDKSQIVELCSCLNGELSRFDLVFENRNKLIEKIKQENIYRERCGNGSSVYSLSDDSHDR